MFVGKRRTSIQVGDSTPGNKRDAYAACSVLPVCMCDILKVRKHVKTLATNSIKARYMMRSIERGQGGSVLAYRKSTVVLVVAVDAYYRPCLSTGNATEGYGLHSTGSSIIVVVSYATAAERVHNDIPTTFDYRL